MVRSAVVLSVVVVCAACKRHEAASIDAKSDASIAPVSDASSYDQREVMVGEEYWLLETPVSARPDGGASKQVVGPALVVLGDDGRVQTPVGSYPLVDGYVPKGILKKPGPFSGLMRYAKRTAELHAESPHGPVIGHVHAGAFVSVAPEGVSDADLGFVLVGSLGSGDGTPLVAYVEKAALGSVTVNVEPQKPIPGGEARATFGVVSTVWYGDGASAKPLGFRRCHEVLLLNEGTQASQLLEGVELTGKNEYAFVWTASPVIHNSLVCPAHAVTRGAEIPAGYARVAPPEPDRLAATIEHGGSLYWLIATGKGPRCDTWRFEFIRKRSEADVTTLEARLVHRGPLKYFEETGSVHYPLRYRTTAGGTPALLHLDTLTSAGHLAMRCICEYDYRILSGEEDEVIALGRPFPDDAVAFDPGEAERWFFSKKACDAHREKAVKEIELDGHQTTHVGFHATELL